MMGLERLGYTKEGQLYKKQLGSYTVILYSSKGEYIRRITKGATIVDIKRVKLDNVENDAIFKEVVRDYNTRERHEATGKEINKARRDAAKNEITKTRKVLEEEIVRK